MNKITITLKQHTPLLHFQPTQEGATLRASEVKPKLDKFLLKKLGGDNYEAGIVKARENGWLIGDSNALNYKMRIEIHGSLSPMIKTFVNRKGKVETETYPLILSNMGGKDGENNVANLSFCSKVSVKLALSDKVEELVSVILGTKESLCPIAYFFANNNFGQRSTKGFGSFMVENVTDGNEIYYNFDNISQFMSSGTPMLKFKVKETDTFAQTKTMFEVLDYYWKLLKSGVNYRKGYIKSYLWQYLNSKGFTWEKREIKQFFNLYQEESEIKENENTPTFARALLGLPEKFEYRFDREVVPVIISNVSKEIDRIGSPIMFKPFISGNDITIYILFDEELIDNLCKLDPKTYQFDFECEREHLKINIAPSSIDYLELIRKFHAFMNANKNKYSDGKEGWSFIPRTFKWENILGKTNNSDNLVYLRQKA